MKLPGRQTRHWGQLVWIVLAGLMVGSGMSTAAKVLAPMTVQARSTKLEPLKASGKPQRSSAFGEVVRI